MINNTVKPGKKDRICENLAVIKPTQEDGIAECHRRFPWLLKPSASVNLKLIKHSYLPKINPLCP